MTEQTSEVTKRRVRGERVYDLSDPREAKLKADNDRKKAARAKEKEAELAKKETNSEMWLRNSQRYFAENPTEYSDLQARHDAVTELEAEVDEIVGGVEAGRRAGIAHGGNVEEWPQIFPQPDIAYADVKTSVAVHGSFNYGAAERHPDFRPPFNAKHDIDNWQHRLYGFHLKLKPDTFPRIREALILYALRTGDKNLNWSIVDDAVDSYIAEPRWSSNSYELDRLVFQYRGETRRPIRRTAPKPEPIWRIVGFETYSQYLEHLKRKEQNKQFVEQLVDEQNAAKPAANVSGIPPTFYRSQIGG